MLHYKQMSRSPLKMFRKKEHELDNVSNCQKEIEQTRQGLLTRVSGPWHLNPCKLKPTLQWSWNHIHQVVNYYNFVAFFEHAKI